jgi:hypothetical protein
MLPARKSGYYFRKSFDVTFPCQELLLSATCTDAGGESMEIWLNGEQLKTSGIDAVTGQGNRVEFYDLTPFAERLRVGTNTIAVALPNIWQASWDDVAFDLRLQAVPLTVLQVESFVIEPEYGASGKLQAVTLGIQVAPETIWRVEKSDALLFDDWKVVERIVSTTSGVFWLRDPIPGNLATTARFYRLVPD